MKYTIYKITNKLNNKIYIGKHQTENINDGYFGSGKALKNSIRKYGKENFVKEILFIFESELEMNMKERELITEEFVKREDTYNLGVGGEGGPHFKGKTHSPESRKKMGRPDRVLSEEARKKISESNRKRVVSEETRRKISVNKRLALGQTLEEAFESIEKNKNAEPILSQSESLKKYYSNPENRKLKAEQMRKLHKEYDLLEMKQDYDNGMKPKKIKEKYNLSRTRYDHIRLYYLK